MSDGSVLTTLGGPMPYLQYCGSEVYESTSYSGPVHLLDPGVWSANGVTQNGILNTWQNTFDVPSYPGYTQVVSSNVGSTYDFFAFVNSQIGSNPDSVDTIEDVFQSPDYVELLSRRKVAAEKKGAAFGAAPVYFGARNC